MPKRSRPIKCPVHEPQQERDDEEMGGVSDGTALAADQDVSMTTETTLPASLGAANCVADGKVDIESKTRSFFPVSTDFTPTGGSAPLFVSNFIHFVDFNTTLVVPVNTTPIVATHTTAAVPVNTTPIVEDDTIPMAEDATPIVENNTITVLKDDATYGRS